MATQFDTSKELFVGANAARGDTVFDALRTAVRDLGEGEGVSYENLEKHMLDNFTPRSAKNYDASYVKAYTRDAVNKFGYLSQESASEYEVITPAAKTPKPKMAEKKAALKSIKASEESSVARSSVTSSEGADVEAVMEALEAEGLISTEQRDGETFVSLTEAGEAKIAPKAAAEPATEETTEEAPEATEEVAEKDEVTPSE